MPVTLNQPTEPVVPDAAKVVAFKVENNVENWIEVWVAFGHTVEGNFVEHVSISPAYFKIEDGCNPLAPNVALCSCDNCDTWLGLETECPDCGDPTTPYDGFSRLVMSTPSGDNMHDILSSALYAFLLNESVPDPDSGEVVPLLDAE